jgi:NADH-quinone oxidoreductase subunit C
MGGDVSLRERIQIGFSHLVLATHDFRGQQTVLIRREGLRKLAQFLKDDPTMAFDFLMDLTCVDYLTFGHSPSSQPTFSTPSPLPYSMQPKALPERWERGVSNTECRFEVVYHFFSSVHTHRLRLKVPLAASDPQVDSLTSLWKAANWFEREVWDMFGIVFTGHPNLKRILMYEPFNGHPLRKDYPFNKRQPLIGPVN